MSKHGSLCYDDEGKVECICGLADAAAAQAELEAELMCGCVPPNPMIGRSNNAYYKH